MKSNAIATRRASGQQSPSPESQSRAVGQLALLLQGHYLKKIDSFPKVQGKPFFRFEIHDRIKELMGVAS